MANQTSEQYTENLFQAIDTIIANRVSKLPYDQTIICEIINADDAEYGKYLARSYSQVNGYNEVSFTVYSDNTEYAVGDRVYVRVPAGDFTQQKVITGNYVAELQNSALVNSDPYWIAEEPILDTSQAELTPFTENVIYSLPDGEIFPGYSVCRIKFRPKVAESLIGTTYTIADLDVNFKVSVQYTVPTIYESATFTNEFTVSVRAYNPNLFRNSNKLLTYDINLDECVGAPIQLHQITLYDLRYAGARADEYQGAGLSFEDISFSFGYYITNNIGQLLTLYTDNNFYNPSTLLNTHNIYAHYYDSTNFETKRLVHISDAQDYFRLSFGGNDIISDSSITQENESYHIVIPVSNNNQNTLNNLRDTYTVFLERISEQNNTMAQDSIQLVNVNYYSNLDSSISSKTSFLTAKALSPEEEIIANYNNGIYYIYGQDGKPTDASASFITRRAYIRFVDYTSTNDLTKGTLTATFPPSNTSMIIKAGDVVIDSEDPTVAYVEYKISNYYAQNKKNNTITWTFSIIGANATETIYTYEQELLFGYSGSQGADYSLILTLANSSGLEVPAILMGQDATYQIISHLYDYNNNEISNQTIQYSKVSVGNSDRWPSWLQLDEATGVLTVSGYAEPAATATTNSYCAVVKASISALAIDAFMPISLRRNISDTLSGPTTITYDITGKKPFTSKLPYKIYREGQTATVQTTSSLIIPQDNPSEALKSLYPLLENNYLSLPSAYSTEAHDAPPTVMIKEGDNVIWVQPLYIQQNKYPNSMNNGESNRVIIPENSGNKQIINTSVGRVLSNGVGMFMGDYGTDANNADYGLYAFKSSPPGVENTFKLLANGQFSASGNITLTDINFNPANIGAPNIPVYYLNGKPQRTMQNIKNDNANATLEDLAKAIINIKEIFAEMTLTPEQQAKLDEIKLTIS